MESGVMQFDRRTFCGALLSSGLVPAELTIAQTASSPVEILFRNVRVFDGQTPRLSDPTTVLVRGKLIAGIGDPATTGQVIDGQGRTLMPGLIDCHMHMMMATRPMAQLLSSDVGFNHMIGAASAHDTLMRGFTSIRDLSGPVFGIRRAIDEGMIAGPRIWGAGA